MGSTRHRPGEETVPRYLVRFGYDGAGFSGFARQPGQRTVEGELLRGLPRLGISPSAEAARLTVSSRTDRGVSARGNTLALSSALPPAALLRALNGIAPEIRFTALARVPDAFRPRAARGRWYRYWEREAHTVPTVWSEAAPRLVGPIDTRTFGRGQPLGSPALRKIDQIRPSIDRAWLVLDVRAGSFVWGMVRKIVSAIRAVEAGRLGLRDLDAAVRGERRLTLPLAEPERLVLMETSVAIEWEHVLPAATPHQARDVALELRRMAARRAILDEIWKDCDPSDGARRGDRA